MATTPIYAIPTPDLGSTADGPSAMAAMASRIEAVMTKFVVQTEYNREVEQSINTGGSVVCHEINLTSTVTVGWLDICISNVQLGDNSGSNPVGMAGVVQLLVNDVLKRSVRYHSQSRMAGWTLGGISTALAVTSATAVNVKLRVAVDPSSLPVRYFSSSLHVRQFGAA